MMKSAIKLGLVGATLLTAACGVGDAQRHLRTAVDARQASLDSCYREALERDESAAGSMKLRLHMMRKATEVSEVEVLESDLGDETLSACVQQALVGVTIDEAPSTAMSVIYMVTFAPEE